ncbi:MAG TPA: nucleoside hydrolase-like domain-containing protein [Fodinibius sp.]|nr:nucleoside hydrolase-like domain-containing protein [Fodinibius sp.]
MKPRVLVLTDITNEPDDQQSLVRFLVYANEFDIEGLIATTSTHMHDEVRPDVIKKLVTAYGEVRSNLLKHADGYPAEQFLLKRTKAHLPVFGMKGVGKGKSTEGSRHIIDVVDKTDDRPVWITVWGGANCLAQALWEVSQERSPEEVEEFVSKIRVYTISDQDDSGQWIRDNYPNLFYIVSASEPTGTAWYYRATWTGISGDKFYQNGPMHRFELVDNPWLEENIMKNHGPLGALYPRVEFIMEGDTPSYFGLVRNGLGWALSPTYGGWGGRYQLAQTFGETRKIWTNTRNSRDKVVAEDEQTYVSDQATIWRWREDFQYDFAARMDWTVMSYEEANHNPEITVNGNEGKAVLRTSAFPGDTIELDASASSDPDSDNLAYNWWVYPEAGTSHRWWIYREAGAYPGDVTIQNANRSVAQVKIPDNYLKDDHRRPKEENSVHIILEVKDDGNPPLRSYRRVIIDIVKE